MEIYDSRHFSLSKNLLCFVGLWPYDSRKKIIRTLWFIAITASNIPQVIALIVDISNPDKVMEHLCILLGLIGICLKHFTLAIAEDKMKIVYENIAKNWLMITDEEEKEILKRYSEKGRFVAVAYAGLMTLSGASFIILPMVPVILNVVDPLPVPRPHIYIFEGEFLVKNKDDHFTLVYIWEAMSTLSIILICASTDSMYIITVEHCSALYAIVAHRLSKLKHRGASNSQAVQHSSYEWVVHTVKLHQTVLSFTDNINESYSMCFFCLTIMSIVAIPVSCVIMMINLHHPVNFIRYGMVLAGFILHVFVLFWPGQKLIDHSTKLLDDATCNEWYETSARTKTVLRIFMVRCTQPSLITAGGLVVMNFENFFKVVKTAGSYITVLASFR